MAVAHVLGGGGFIGACLVRRLVADGHRVRAVDVAFPEFRRAAWDGADCWTLDLTDRRQAHNAIDGADWVFHLAADMGGVGYFHSDADLGAAMRNGRITLNVLESADLCDRLFYAASACVYPIERAGELMDETMIGQGTPDALYGAEKLHGLRLCSKTPNARVGVFDTVYGPLQEHEGRRMKFPTAVATKALKARQTGMLELWGDGTQTRCYLDIDDALDRVLTVMASDVYEGPVNIGAATPVSCREIAELCLDIAGADAVIVTNPAEPSGVPARVTSQARYQAVYGDTHETGYRDGFAKLIDWLEAL